MSHKIALLKTRGRLTMTDDTIAIVAYCQQFMKHDTLFVRNETLRR